MTDQLAIAERQSVQELPDAKMEDANSSSFWYMGETSRTWLLPPWGTRMREQRLRMYYRHEYNWLLQSAIAGLTKKVVATPWELSGPPTKNPSRRVRYFQDVLRQANFGRGWRDLIMKVLLDFFRQDGGAYIELIAPGNPLKAPTGRISGLAYLDSLRCYPTGDPEYPVIYYDRKGGKHLLHNARVIHLADMPDGDEANPGYGLSALSRAISIVSREINMNRYVDGKLDDKPPPGFVVASNINKGERDAAIMQFNAEQGGDVQPPWGKTVWLYGTNPQFPVDLKYITFAQAPENWSLKEYTELDVNAVAAAIGTDVQEIWQLTGGNIGSGQQSQVLHQKSQGKAFGDVLSELTRGLNDALPEDMEFEFKRRDAQESQSEASTAQTWVSVAGAWQDATPDERRKLLANKVEAIGDAITDANGEIVRLQDADVAPDTEKTADDASPNSMVDTPNDANADEQTADSAKEWGDTRAEFVGLFKDLVRGTLDGDVNRRRAGVVLRGQLSRLGRKAYEDGLTESGVADGMDDDDRARLLVWAAEQSRFVTQFLDELVSEGLTDKEVDVRAGLWADKSLEEAHRLGQLSASANALYEWQLGVADHCKSCVKMAGQVHRLSTYVRKGITPKADVLKCTLGCHCKLVRTTGKARGRWL